MGNTGRKKFTTLREYFTGTNVPTGRSKANIASDPDYVAPTIDLASCPTTTTTTVGQINVNVVLPGSGTYIITVKKASFSQSKTTAGSWLIPDYIYDSVTFALSGYSFGGGTLRLQVTYGGGIIDYVDVTDNWTVELPGTLNAITDIKIF